MPKPPKKPSRVLMDIKRKMALLKIQKLADLGTRDVIIQKIDKHTIMKKD
jgi:hypothetical protein